MKTKYTNGEISKMLLDATFWRRITKYIPSWKLHGWTDQQSATFFTDQNFNTLHLTKAQYLNILSALEATHGTPNKRRTKKSADGGKVQI